MTEANGAVSFTAQMLASESCDVGDLLVYDDAAGYWRVATSANRATAAARAQAVALTAYGGSTVGKVQYRSAGLVPESVTDLGPGTESLVRCSSTGRFERIAAGSVNPSTDDIVGLAYADGRVNLFFGIPIEELATIIGGGGGGATPGGSVGSVQIHNPLNAFDGIDPGANGNVLMSNGTAWQSAAPTTGAPTNASYVTIALNGTLTDERVLVASGVLGLADGGANGNATLTVVGGANGSIMQWAGGVPGWLAAGTDTYVLTMTGGVPGWAAPSGGLSVTGTGVVKVVSGTIQSAASTIVNADVNAAAAIAITKLTQGSNGHVFMTSSSVNTFGFITNANVDSAAAIAVTKLALGTNGTFLGTQGGSNQFTNRATYFGVGTGTLSTVGGLRFANGAEVISAVRNSGNSADVIHIAKDASDNLYLGTSTSFNAQASNVNVYASGAVALGLGGTTYLYCNASQLQCWQPVSGTSTGSLPFRFASATISLTGATTLVLSAAQYSCPYLNFINTPSTTCHVQAPNLEGATHFVHSASLTNFSFGDTSTAATGVIDIGTTNKRRGMLGHNGTDYIERTGWSS